MNRWGLEFTPMGSGVEMAEIGDGIYLYYHPDDDVWWIVDLKRLLDTPNMRRMDEAKLREWLQNRAAQ